SRAVALLPRMAAAGVERARVLVQADEQDRRVVLERRLRAVAVVHVEVHDGDFSNAVNALQVAGGDGDAGEEAEAHRPVGLGVVAGRADGGERAANAAGGRRRAATP